ncbi:hypothetical protein AK812_SmicGene45114, partial [Symbiodinium microadriaticum]
MSAYALASYAQAPQRLRPSRIRRSSQGLGELFKEEEDGVRKRAVPEAQKAAVPAPAPAKEAPVSAKENTPPPAAPERFALRARATLQGASVLRSLEGVEARNLRQKQTADSMDSDRILSPPE